MSDSTPSFNVDEATALADILLGAAYSDGDFAGSEAEAIEKILKEVVQEDELPDVLTNHIAEFQPEDFDLSEACSRLHLVDADERRSVLKLVADVTDADTIFDLAEDAYIKLLAVEIGSEPDEYADLTVEIVSISALATPPPIPDDA